MGRLHPPDLREVSYQLAGELDSTPLHETVVDLPAGALRTPARATLRTPAGATGAVRVPAALTVPVVPVAWLAVVIRVVVAAVPVPIVAPARVVELTGTPVIVRERAGGLGLGQTRRSQTGKS